VVNAYRHPRVSILAWLVENADKCHHSSPLILPILKSKSISFSCRVNNFWLIVSFSFCSKGISQSALPYRRSVPTWLKLSCDDVQEQIYKLAKKGLTPSQIGKHLFNLSELVTVLLCCVSCHSLVYSELVNGQVINRFLSFCYQVSFCETLTVWPKSVSSLATRCCASSRRRDSLPSFPRTCTSWSRRPFPFASILSATARTAMPSSGSFWSSPVFIDWRVTTKPSAFSRPPGSTRVAQPLPSCHKWRDEQGRKKRTTRQQNDVPCLPLELTENTHFPVDLQTQTCSFLYLLSSWMCIHAHTHCLFCLVPCFIWLKVAGAREKTRHVTIFYHTCTRTRCSSMPLRIETKVSSWALQVFFFF